MPHRLSLMETSGKYCNKNLPRERLNLITIYPIIKDYFYTNSQVVYGDINNNAKRFKVFVADRVQLVGETSHLLNRGVLVLDDARKLSGQRAQIKVCHMQMSKRKSRGTVHGRLTKWQITRKTSIELLWGGRVWFIPHKETFKHFEVLWITTGLVSCAVFIETMRSMETDSFKLALRCFIARRGNIRTIWYNNRSNFVGAERESWKNLWRRLIMTKSRDLCSIKFQIGLCRKEIHS